MEEVLKKGKVKKFDFRNKESQRLFEEFTNLLGDLSKGFEGLDVNDGKYPNPLVNYRSRDLLREINVRFRNMLVAKWCNFKEKLMNMFNIKR